MQIIRPLALLAFAVVCQRPAFAAGGDTSDYSGNYAATPATAPTPASTPEVPGYQLPRENALPDAEKLLGAPHEVGASEPDDDTTRDASRRAKPLFATTVPPRRHEVLPNPWPPAWRSTNSTPAYRNPW
jgi:hypothetical protein